MAEKKTNNALDIFFVPKLMFGLLKGISSVIVAVLKYFSRFATQSRLAVEKSWIEAKNFRSEAEGISRTLGTTDPLKVKKQGQALVVAKGTFLIVVRIFLAFFRAL